MPSANHLLRSARERAGLTRDELAEHVRRYVWERSEREPAIDAHYVAKLERGVIRRPGREYRKALRAVLRAQTDADLGMTTSANVPAAHVPGRDTDPVRAQAESFRLADRSLGGSRLYPLVHRFLAETVVSAAVRDRADGLTGVAVVTDMCGWMAFEAGDSHSARLHFDAAHGIARATGDPAVSAYACASMAHLADEMGMPDDAVRMANAGRESLRRESGAPPSLAGRLLAMEARGHAGRGDAARCREVLAAADASTPLAAPEEPWWLPAFDLGSLRNEAAVCWRRLGRLDDAERCAHEVLGWRGAGHVRSRALAELTLAEVALARDDIDGAAGHATDVARAARGLASRPVGRRLEALALALHPHRRRGAAATFLEVRSAPWTDGKRWEWPV